MAKSTEVAKTDDRNTLPANFELDNQELEGLEGLGYSEKAEDGLVPILSLLQDNSGEVKKNHPKRLEGAEAGLLVVRSLKRVIQVSKDAPLLVQPCGFQHMWVQWRGEPGEGQVIKQYPFDDRPDEAVEKPDPQNDDRNIWVMPNGDRLVDTRYHYCHVMVDGNWMPMVIPMGGTNHTVSRQWTERMKAIRVPGTNQRAPAWFRIWLLSTSFNSRGAQSWYTYDIGDGGWCEDKTLRDAGRVMFENLQQGIIAPDAGDNGDGTTTPGAADSDDAPV